MNLQDIEPINTTEHLMEIRKSSKCGTWLLKTTRNGVVLESYRPLTKEETLQIIGAALQSCSPLETSDVRWEYEDELPEMEDADFDAIFPASRVLGLECGGVRMYPYVEDSSGNRIWITHLPSEANAIVLAQPGEISTNTKTP